ncbi:MAG: pantoate--beta-alanine ligase [Bacteroidetes bacterium]|nr:pantoate--beta-alanine ligase [Bacteroidota bacterium]
MKIIQTVSALRRWRAERPSPEELGFVPTMGALHAGHLSLLKAAQAQSDAVIASIFVNPTQFDRPDDLAAYPREEARDLELLEAAGCQAVFMPHASEMYPSGASRVHISLPPLTGVWEGASRPGHFDGVALIVNKLLMLVQPHHLYMGQKDFQQTVVIRAMLEELFIPTELRVRPTLREADGLAMSSRNVRLSPAQRAQAACLYATLSQMHKQWQEAIPPGQIVSWAAAQLQGAPGCQPDYVQLVHGRTLEPVTVPLPPEEPVVALVAAFFGPVRLIDCLPMTDQTMFFA